MSMSIEEAKKLDHFLCSDCSSDDDAKRSLNSFPVSTTDEGKVRDASTILNKITQTHVFLLLNLVMRYFLC